MLRKYLGAGHPTLIRCKKRSLGDDIMHLKPGMTAFNHRTNSFWDVLSVGRDNSAYDFEVRITCQAHGEPDTRLHVHTNCVEEFEILEGRAQYVLGKSTEVAKAGDTIVFPSGVPHQHPWADGSARMIYVHKGRYSDNSLKNTNVIWGATLTTFGLAKDPSQLDWNGMPYSKLQTAAIARSFGMHGAYDCIMPIFLGRIVNATVGVFANLMGYEGVIDAEIAKARKL